MGSLFDEFKKQMQKNGVSLREGNGQKEKTELLKALEQHITAEGQNQLHNSHSSSSHADFTRAGKNAIFSGVHTKNESLESSADNTTEENIQKLEP